MRHKLSRLQNLDRTVNRWLREWRVPGAAVAVLRNGKTVFVRGYGYRDAGRRLPVTENTLFAIGSCTKAITATAMGILVDENKISWDAPVREYVPSFRLHDRIATEQATIRDLLCHRTGLPRHDLMWEGTSLTRGELFDRLRYLEPSDGFRNRYQYNNLIYAAVGVVLEHVAGCSWEEFVRTRITTPLGMNSVNFSNVEMAALPDHALGYDRRPGGTVHVPHENIVPVGPAGSINAHLLDMCRWTEFQMSGGKVGRKRILTEKTQREIHTPQITLRETPMYEELLDPTYALGWSVQPYRGRRRLVHSGCMDGYNASVSFMPAEKIGIAVLTNVTASPLIRMIPYYVFDCLLGDEPIDWNRRFHAEERAKLAARPKRARGRRHARPSHPMKEYAGRYDHPAYGSLLVSVNKGRLSAAHNGFIRPLDHIQYDQFEMVSRGTWPWRKRVTFRTGHDGTIIALAAALQDGVKDIDFKRAKTIKQPKETPGES